MWSGFQEYWQEKWNWLDAFSLILLSIGLYIRTSLGDPALIRVFYALSAPLVFSRILFFGQVLPRQGLVIQVGACSPVRSACVWYIAKLLLRRTVKSRSNFGTCTTLDFLYWSHTQVEKGLIIMADVTVVVNARPRIFVFFLVLFVWVA